MCAYSFTHLQPLSFVGVMRVPPEPFVACQAKGGAGVPNGGARNQPLMWWTFLGWWRELQGMRRARCRVVILAAFPAVSEHVVDVLLDLLVGAIVAEPP